MPSSAVKLIPGVNTDKTPSLNEAGISASNMIRFREGLIEKRGGWTNLLPSPVSGVPRAVWAWRDFNSVKWVAIGTTNGLFVETNGLIQDISPRVVNSNVSYFNFGQTQYGALTIYDPSFLNPTAGTVLNVSVFGLYSMGNAIYGSYPVINANTLRSVRLEAPESSGESVIGSPWATAFKVPFNFAVLTSTAGSQLINIYLYNAVAVNALGSPSFTLLKPISIGGTTLSGLYPVNYIYAFGSTTPDPSNFTIKVSQPVAFSDTYDFTSSTIPIQYALAPVQYGATIVGTSSGSSDWCLGNYGEILIACAVGGHIYQWQSDNNYANCQVVPNAPQASGIVISDAAQQIIAYGGAANTAYDPNYVAWCDTGNINVWTAGVGNQAGSYRIPSGSGIIGAAAVGSTLILLWTDIDVWTMQYIGYPLVYGFNKIGSGCGLAAQFAWARLGGATYWMSQNRFWVFDGQGVQVLDCPVYDNVFPVISKTNAWKIRCGSNSAFSEVMWFFPSATGTGENDTYVCFNPTEGTWDVGSMARSAWVDQSVVGLPIAADPSGNIYQHETSPNAAGSAMAWSFTTGLFQISEGEEMAFIDRLRPDFKFPQGVGTIQVSVMTYKYPGDTPVVRGPYSFTAATEYISTRCRGRYVALQFSGSDVGSFWRIGRTQFRFQPDGRR